MGHNMARVSPFFWWDVAQANWETALRLGETMVAANSVIGSRTETMRAAARNPLAGDYAELSRMVIEKVDAFAHAGASLMHDIHAAQTEALTAISRAGAMARTGTTPGLRHFAELSASTARITEHMTGAPGRALRPVHARATANARRLRKKA